MPSRQTKDEIAQWAQLSADERGAARRQLFFDLWQRRYTPLPGGYPPLRTGPLDVESAFELLVRSQVPDLADLVRVIGPALDDEIDDLRLLVSERRPDLSEGLENWILIGKTEKMIRPGKP